MSTEALVWAWKIRGLTPAQKAVLVALANYADQDRTCYPSVRLIHEMTELSERSVIRSIRDLEERGYIATETRSTEKGRQTSNLYRFTTPPRGDRVSPPGVTQGHPDPDRVSPLEPKKESSPSDEGDRAKRASRIQEPFVVSDTMRSWAAKDAPDVDLDVATATFVDYWAAVPGAKGVKLDWERTWRNSMRSDQEAGRHRKTARSSSIRERYAGVRQL